MCGLWSGVVFGQVWSLIGDGFCSGLVSGLLAELAFDHLWSLIGDGLWSHIDSLWTYCLSLEVAFGQV